MVVDGRTRGVGAVRRVAGRRPTRFLQFLPAEETPLLLSLSFSFYGLVTTEDEADIEGNEVGVGWFGYSGAVCGDEWPCEGQGASETPRRDG